MDILQSPEFIRAIKILNKPKLKNTYGSIRNELNDFFSQYFTFEAVWNKHYCLSEEGHIRINKIRLDNTKQNSGKSGGYRLIVICNKVEETVILLYIYPKTGSHGSVSIEKSSLRKLIKKCLLDKENGLLTPF